jgi:TonB family protein
VPRASRFLAFAFAMAIASRAFAQDAPSDAQLVPPRLLTTLTPTYPEGAEGDASVVLAVTIGTDGNVKHVRVLEGAEPFATQAIAIVQNARFVPAAREGIPVPATIRFQLDFTKPKPPPPPEPEPEPNPEPPPAGSNPSTAPKKPEPPKVQDVFVRGGRSNIASSAATDTLGRAEVRQLPGAFGDPFRAIEVAPGLTPVITGLPYFYVRGAPPGNVGYYFDGVRVPYLFHFGLGPAVIHPALIARTDLHKGGYPAQFGRYAGGIVDGAIMPPADRTHGEGLLRIIDAGGLIEAPFANGRGSALAAGRYSYTAALFTLLQADTTLDYRDYQTRISYALSDRDTISFLGFGAYDLASQRELVDPAQIGVTISPTGNPNERREITRVLFASEFHRADFRWDHTLGNGGHMRVAGTVGYDRTRVEARRAAEDVMTGLRLDLVQPLSKAVVLRAGGDLVVDQYHGDALPKFADDDDVVARQEDVFSDRTDFATGVRVDAVLVPWKDVEVVPGARLDVFGSAGQRAVSVDPRLSARFAVTDKFRIVHAYGLASQAPSTPVVLPAIGIAGLRGGLQRSVQTSAGVEADLPSDFTATASVFHNAFYDLNDALGTAQVELIDIERSDTLLEKSRGSAYGLELGIRRKLTQRLTGLIAYTLSRSERTQGPRKFLSAYDRPHVVNAVLSYDLGHNWRAGGRFVFYSGVPTIAGAPAFPEQVVAIPPPRTPPFLRVDLRLEKRWKIGQRGWVSVVLEALNATLSQEVTGYRCATALALPGRDKPTPTCGQRVVGPVTVPSLGVEGGF